MLSDGADTRSMTYDEISEAMEISRESARQLAIRRRWRRTRGNDGKARVDVPIQALDARTGTPGDTGDDPSADTDAAVARTSDDTGAGPSLHTAVDVLARYVDQLVVEAAEARAAATTLAAERDAARAAIADLRVQTATAEARAAAADTRAADAAAERDRWHATATAPRGWWSHLFARHPA